MYQPNLNKIYHFVIKLNLEYNQYVQLILLNIHVLNNPIFLFLHHLKHLQIFDHLFLLYSLPIIHGRQNYVHKYLEKNLNPINLLNFHLFHIIIYFLWILIMWKYVHFLLLFYLLWFFLYHLNPIFLLCYHNYLLLFYLNLVGLSL